MRSSETVRIYIDFESRVANGVTEKFQDISLNQVSDKILTLFSDTDPSLQWLALTPPELVKAHLGFSDDVIAKLTKTKQTVIGPA